MPIIQVQIEIPEVLFHLFSESGMRTSDRFAYFKFKADTDVKWRVACDCMLSHIEQKEQDRVMMEREIAMSEYIESGTQSPVSNHHGGDNSDFNDYDESFYTTKE